MRAIIARFVLVGWLPVLGAAAHAATPDARELLFARLPANAQQAQILRISDQGTVPEADLQMPLGSLWKLFVYYYVVDRDIPAPEYRCTGGAGASKEEIYCCDPGQAIGLDKALAQSCGLFFEPARLRLDARDWAAYWKNKAPEAQWLRELDQLHPDLKVSVTGLLRVLARMNGEARVRAESALLAVVLNGRGQSALRYLGGRYRIKTYTWTHPQNPGIVFGGAAGWMSDGSAVWFGAVGSSVRVLQDHAPRLAAMAEGATGSASSGRCVDVALFARYPIRSIVVQGTGETLKPGVERDLRGRYKIEFENGHQLTIQANSETRLSWAGDGRPLLSARLDEDEYLARVLDREASASEPEAAKALTVVARTYLLQNAVQHGECLAIADSSRTQRVSPNPSSASARNIVKFTAGLVLQGAGAHYRLDGGGVDVLSWKKAVELAKQGLLFDEILQRTFEHGSLASVDGEAECRILPGAQRWLRAQARQWRTVLEHEPGFVEPQAQVCQLFFGNPYSDSSRQRIYVRGQFSLNDRYALAHEYLHLAFSGYPSGQDEMYIEQWARRLIEGGERS
jgi:uncharacterized protein YfaQ (DUF2300 family)